MKKIRALTGLVMAVCAAGAQEITVPAQNSTRPLWVDASTHNGSLTVKTYNGKEVLVQNGNSPKKDRERGAPPGFHRLDEPSRGLVVEAADNRVTVRDNTAGGGADIVITVPVQTSLQLEAHNGNITVDGVHGEIDADSHNGTIRLTNVSGTVVASARNNGVIVTMDRLDPSKPSSFSSVNGEINVSLPADVKANLKMRAENAGIYSDFDVTMNQSGVISQRTSNGRGYRLSTDRTIQGTVNGGGTELTFTTVNGNIYVKKK